MNPVKLLIGTPCYGGSCFTEYTSSLLRTQKYFLSLPDSEKIAIDFTFLTKESLITRGRNTITAQFLANPSYTHLMFIDADIKFDPEDIHKLIKADKLVIGGAYPKKGYDWNRIQKLIEKGDPDWKACASDYVVRFLDGPEGYRTINGLIPVEYLGTGFLLIQRNVIEQLIQKFPECKYEDYDSDTSPEICKWLYTLFDTDIVDYGSRPDGKPDRRFLSEDYLFCKRWSDLSTDNKIWLDPKIRLIHIGYHRYEGNFEKTCEFGS